MTWYPNVEMTEENHWKIDIQNHKSKYVEDSILLYTNINFSFLLGHDKNHFIEGYGVKIEVYFRELLLHVNNIE